MYINIILAYFLFSDKYIQR